MAEPKKLLDPTLIPLFDELRGERVIVRPYREEDAPAMYEAVAELREHIRPWLPFADEHQSVDESRAWINGSRAHWILRQDINCGIFEAATDRFLGGIGLHVHSWEIPSFEIGYWLRKSAEGHGYMSEAARLLTDFVLNDLKANRVEIQCDERNTHSASVAKRLGYIQEGRLRNEAQAPDGAVRNTLIFSRVPGD
jgi:RimJ/RimL family protein N-acetyltransferase